MNAEVYEPSDPARQSSVELPFNVLETGPLVLFECVFFEFLDDFGVFAPFSLYEYEIVIYLR